MISQLWQSGVTIDTIAPAQAGFFGSAVTSERFWILAACCLRVPEARPPFFEVGRSLPADTELGMVAEYQQQAERLERDQPERD